MTRLFVSSGRGQRAARRHLSLAQTPVAKPVPRTADGKPDLSGVWVGGGFALLFGDAELEAIRKYDAAMGRKPLPPPEPPPYKPEAEKKRQEYLARRGVDDPDGPMSAVRRAAHHREAAALRDHPAAASRRDPLRGPPRVPLHPDRRSGHPDDIEPSYLGDSVGRWEGDTLVVDVTGFNTNTWLVGVGTFHSEKLRVTERYTRDTHDTIIYEATMEDPEVLTKPWKQYATLRLRPGERIREYECIENNEDIQRFEKLLQTEFKK